MKYLLQSGENRLQVSLFGEIDMEIADELRIAIDDNLSRTGVRNVTFDLNEVSFIDSSGLGVILGRYRKVSEIGGKVTLTGAGPTVYKLLDLSGFCKIMEVQQEVM